MMGVERGFEVHIYDRLTGGPKPDVSRALGATYHGGGLSMFEALTPDIIVECTGATAVIADVVTRSAPSGIVCLAGVSLGGHTLRFDLGDVNRQMVLENDVVFGSVNANPSHYELAATALAAVDPTWLSRLITRRVPLADWQQAFVRQPDDIKVLIDFNGGA